MGRSIFFGLIIGIPAAIVAGPLLGWFLARRWPSPATASAPVLSAVQTGGVEPESAQSGQSAGPLLAAVAILLPILLIFLGSWADALSPAGSFLNRALRFAGYPDIALLIAVLVALFTLGPHIDGSAHGRERLRQLTAESFVPIAGAIVILSAAGGLSGVLRDSGAAQATVSLAMGAHMPPLVLAWLLAAVVRVCMGSATVAMAVAAGVLAPMAGIAGIRPELLVMATGSGSLMLSHVNDSGFWLVQSLFGISTKQTLATWSIVETVLSISGLLFTLLLAVFVR